MSTEGLLLVLMICGFLITSRIVAALGAEVVPWYRDATYLFTLPWALAAIVYTLPLYIYREPLGLNHVLYISSCHFMFLLGAMLSRFVAAGRRLKVVPLRDSAYGEGGKLIWIIAAAGLAGQLLILAGGLMSNPMSFVDRISGEGLAELRLRNVVAGAGSNSGPFTRVNFLGAAAFVFVLMYAGGGGSARAFERSGSRRLLALLAVVSVLLVSFNALFVRGGRMEVVLLAVGGLFAALMDEDRSLLRAIRVRFGVARLFWGGVVMLAALSLVWYMATSFTKSRIGTAAAYDALEQYSRTKPSAALESFTNRRQSLEFVALNLSYLSVPLATFGYYFDLKGSLFPGPFFGQYNFNGPVTFFMRRIGLREEQRTLQEIRSEATADLRIRGYGDNVWSTALRDIALDFGWVGTPAVLFVFGYFAQSILLSAGVAKRGISMALGPLIILVLLLSIAHSIFVLESFAVGFYFCLLVIGWQSFMRHFKRIGGQRGVKRGAHSASDPHPPDRMALN